MRHAFVRGKIRIRGRKEERKETWAVEFVAEVVTIAQSIAAFVQVDALAIAVPLVVEVADFG